MNVYFDNLVVSNSYIGPIEGDDFNANFNPYSLKSTITALQVLTGQSPSEESVTPLLGISSEGKVTLDTAITILEELSTQ